MGRPKGSKNTKPRAKARTPYETYSYWYDKYTKGEKAGWFRPKLNKKEFEDMYELAKRARVTNPARAVAMSQEYVNRKFEREYKKFYGKKLGDIRDKKERERLFTDFVEDRINEGYDYDSARQMFETYFY